MRLPVLNRQHGTITATASYLCFEGSHGFLNVDKDKDGAEKYNQNQECHYGRDDGAENPPR